MFHMQSGEVKIAEHTKIEISINKHGKSSKESETLFWNVALKVSTINWKLTCKTIHSDTQVIQTVPIGKYTFKHKTVQYIKTFHGTEGYKAESVPGEEKNQTLPALEEKKGGGGVEAQQTHTIHHIISDTFCQSSHKWCWSVKDPGAIRQASWEVQPVKKSSLQAHTWA